jgi:FkbM family methyltransferase
MLRRLFRSVLEQTPKLAMLYRNLRDLINRNQKVITTKWGFSITGNQQMANGNFEPDETKIVRNFFNDIDLFVNVGANIGYYCLHALSAGKKIIAIEPISRNLHFLMLNIKNNNFTCNSEIFPVALGKTNDILQMWGGGTGASLIKGWASMPESYVTQVPVLTLDRILCNNVLGKKVLILVDIEGSEFMMLEGAELTLKMEPSPIWMLEISLYEHQPNGRISNPYFSNTFEIFFKNGYRAFVADETGIELNKSDISEIEKGVIKLTTSNFIFKK